MNAARLTIIALLLAASLARPVRADSAAADPHQQLQQILQQPSFNAWRLRQSDPHEYKAMSQFFNRLGDAWDRFWNWLFPPKKAQNPTTEESSTNASLPTILTILAWVVIGGACLFMAFLLYKMFAEVKPLAAAGHILSREQIEQAMDRGDALALDADAWLSHARALATENNFRAAYRALYLALLSGLHTAGKIDHSPHRTNWTYVQHYRGPADERVLFGDLTDLFDHVWYGHKQQITRDLDQLQRQITSLTRPAAVPA